MASSSSSSLIQMSFKYDVFLSFRGEDTRNNFVGHLYEAFQRNCIETYKDDKKIEQGEKISNQLIKSIEDSKFYIIIFSKNYASSSWCLEELVKIMECQKMTEHTAFPVFYDVEPTEVRKQIGPVREAFSKHENQEAAGKWRDAIKELADLAGWELKATTNGDESKLIEIIVNVILKKKYSTLSKADEKLVGMDTRITDVLSSLEIGTEDVRMIGIKGIGGGGKTTLARAVYDRISTMFEGKSFVENVREVSKPSLSGLKKLQKRILKDVLSKQDITFSSVHDGKNMLKDMMRRRKTLVVLDDVDCIEQLEALAGEPNWFKLGSRIIITTRDEQVLLAHRVNFVHDVNLLSSTEAICLFSRYAFQTEIPTQGFEELSGQVVQYAHGLPLTIKVLGSFLCDQKEPYWIDAIERLKTIPLTATMKRLEISFDGLEDDEYKEIFLDVACILKGWEKEDAIRVLESRGFRAIYGLRVLEQKSLITISGYRPTLGMHDHLEEMGRNIVRRLHPGEPNKHSRLWIDAEIEDILTNDLGTQATKCLSLQSPGFSSKIALKGLAKMKDLRFIFVKDDFNSNIVQFDEVSEYLPTSLRFMRWSGFPFSSLPNTFQGKNLVELDISRSNIVQLWEDGEGKVLNNLRFLKIRSSNLRTFDFRLAPNLNRLTIDYCDDLEELHIPADHHSKLEYLTLTASKLTNLHLRNTPNLKILILDSCNDLVELQMPAESPKLQYLHLYRSKLKTLHLGSTPNLETLILEGCNDLADLKIPDDSLKLQYLDLNHLKLKTLHLESTPNLEMLILQGCNDLVELQMPAESLKLLYLELGHSKLTNLHIGNTPNLERLVVNSCNDLVELQMPAESPKLQYLYLYHSKLKTLHLRSTPNLETLVLEGSNDLLELKIPDDSLKLKYLTLNHSKLKTLHLGSTPNLERLRLKGCNDLVELQIPAESLKLQELNLSHSKLGILDLMNTPNLKRLILEGCNDLVELQMPAESLKLEELNLSHSKLRTLDLGLTPNLKRLNLENCYDLVEINAPDGYLKKLDFLDLSCCGRFKSFVFDKWSEPAEAGSLSELHLIAEIIDVCLLHPDNSFPKFRFECYYKEDPASLFGNPEILISMGLCVCTNLENFSRSICSLRGLRKLKLEGSISEAPKELDQLECLEELIFSSTNIRNLPDSICKLKHLKSLELKSCLLFEKLPDDLGRIESLQKLTITDCNRLRDIPNNIGKIKCVVSPKVYKRNSHGKYKQQR